MRLDDVLTPRKKMLDLVTPRIVAISKTVNDNNRRDARVLGVRGTHSRILQALNDAPEVSQQMYQRDLTSYFGEIKKISSTCAHISEQDILFASKALAHVAYDCFSCIV